MPLTDATRTAAVLDALHDVLRAALPDDVGVIDGQPTSLSDEDVIIVGFSAARPAVELTQSIDDLAGGRIESLTIACLASAWRGDTDEAAMRRVRARAVELLGMVATALADDPTLGDVVSSAEIGTVLAADQAQTPDGPSVTIDFSVVAETL